jgi:hypothetical protein
MRPPGIGRATLAVACGALASVGVALTFAERGAGAVRAPVSDVPTATSVREADALAVRPALASARVAVPIAAVEPDAEPDAEQRAKEGASGYAVFAGRVVGDFPDRYDVRAPLAELDLAEDESRDLGDVRLLPE